MEQRYGINLQDGRIVPFNEETERQTAYAEVPEDIAIAVDKGEIDWHAVVELIHKKRNNDPDFSWDAFDKLRNQQNIRRAKYEYSGDSAAAPDATEDGDKVRQVPISMSELKGQRAVKATDNVSAGDSVAHASEPKARATTPKVIV